MSIYDNKFIRKSIEFMERNHGLAIFAVIVLVGVSSFTMGRMSALSDNPEMTLESGLENFPQVASVSIAGKGVVASKEGEKYHYPWCSGSKRINPENRITFGDQNQALQAGYEPAQNCPGL